MDWLLNTDNIRQIEKEPGLVSRLFLLNEAIREGRIDCVTLLLNMFPELTKAKNKEDYSVLELAILARNVEILRLVLGFRSTFNDVGDGKDGKIWEISIF